MVEREEVHAPFAVGSVVVMRAVRGAAGRWSVELDVNFRIKIDDTRDIYVRKMLSTVANEQRGRKRRFPNTSGEKP